MNKILKTIVVFFSSFAVLFSGLNYCYASELEYGYSMMGDVNDDLAFSVEDYVKMEDYFVSEGEINEDNANYNGDGEINLLDCILMKEKMIVLSEISSYSNELTVSSGVSEEEKYVFDKLNDFRVKYGLGKTTVDPRLFDIADEYVDQNLNNYSVYVNFRNELGFFSYYSGTAESGEELIEKMFIDCRYKGSILIDSKMISVGNKGNKWLVIIYG